MTHSTPARVAWYHGLGSICWGILVGAAVSAIVIPVAVRASRTFQPAHAAAMAPAAAVGRIDPMPAAVATPVARSPQFADFLEERPSPDARHVADWVADSRDSANADFIIVDKKDARVYVFDGSARLRGASPVLLGSALGDDTVPGIGSRPIALVRPEERTTPAGRFIAERGRSTFGEDVIWVDYQAAVSMHRVRTINPQERRLQRLATPSIADNRISYGCINLPKAFYEGVVSPVFDAHRAVVYVLPDLKPVQQVFGSYDVAEVHTASASR